MDFKTYYHSFNAQDPATEAELLRHREEIKRKLTEALLANHINVRCVLVPEIHPVDRLLNRKRKPRVPRTEIIDVVSRKAE